MGTRWTVTLGHAAPVPETLPETLRETLPATLHEALQNAVTRVDQQMSTWRADSALMRFNAAATDQWHPLPAQVLTVLAAGLKISRMTGGAFEMNIGDAVRAWGFGAAPIAFDAIQAARAQTRANALDALSLDLAAGLARKSAPLSLDLSGIAKGYAVDCLREVLIARGIDSALCAIDGEVRALGARPDGTPWSVAIETPEGDAPLSVVALAAGALATSGDYRHFVKIKGARLSHTMDPRRAAPLIGAPASVTVRAACCMTADALATALMVMGPKAGLDFAQANDIPVLFMVRDGQDRLLPSRFSNPSVETPP